MWKRHGTAALVMVLVVGIGGFAEVSAQVDIDPIGPDCVAADDPDSTYEALVWTNWDFWFELAVYQNGYFREYSLYYIFNSGPGVYLAKVVSHSGWNLQTNDVIDYLGFATIAEGPFYGWWDSELWRCPVFAPGTCALPARREQPAEEARYAIRQGLA